MARFIDPRGYCDCCDKLAPLSRCWAAGGIETFACTECRGVEVEVEDDDEERYRTEMGEI